MTGRHQGMQAVTLCISTTMVLILLGLVVLSVLTARNLSKSVKEHTSISLVLGDTISVADGQALLNEQQQQPYTREAKYISEEEALRVMTAEMGANPVDFAGGITNALTRARDYCKEKGKDLRIEIEVRTFDEIREALATNIPDRIMLDNFTPAKTKEAVDIIRSWEKENKKHIEIESSGGITIDTLRDYAVCGVDFISVGALTHSVKSLDMSFKAVK